MVHEAAEHRPSKKRVELSRERIERLIKIDAVPRYIVAALLDEIDRLQRDLTLMTERKDAVNETLAAVVKERNELRASAPKPPHEREPPHCSNCSCGMPAQPPRERYMQAAWVPVHPREGLLWANAIKTQDADRPTSYPLVPVFVHAVTKKPGISEPPVVVDDGEEFDADEMMDQLWESRDE